MAKERRNYEVLVRTGGITGHRVGDFGRVTTTIYSRRLAPEYPEMAEGGWLVDAAGLDGLKVLALQSPILDIELDDDEVEGCPEISGVMKEGLEDGFAALAQLSEIDGFTGMDRVGLGVYLAYWRGHGARIGQRVKDEVVWEDGTREPIESASN